MTSQVIVGNTRAVAIASDSSVTVNNGGGSRGTFANAEKVFPLPGPHRLAVLHSGNVKVMGVPIDVILGEWIMELGSGALPTVEAYVDHFTEWLGKQQRIFSSESQRDHFLETVRRYILDLRKAILKSLEDVEGESQRLDSVLQDLRSDLRYVESRDLYSGLDRDWAYSYAQEHSDELLELLDWAFDDVPMTDEAYENLVHIGVSLACRVSPFASFAYLAFAGFGVDDVFPSWILTDLDGVLGGRARLLAGETTRISPAWDAVLSPLGQSEAMNTFLRGYDYSFRNVASERLDESVRAQLVEGDPEEQSLLEKSLGEAKEALRDDFDRVSSERFVDPMIRTVAAMPAKDLARVAEALVGLQMLRQLTQAEMETVGGPIDVALITRAGGFMWVGGKHVS